MQKMFHNKSAFFFYINICTVIEFDEFQKFEICNCVKIHVFSEYIFMLPLQILYVQYKGQEVWLTWKLRKTVSRLKNTAMEKKPNMRRGFLPIRSITKPWRKDSIINNRVLYIIFGCRVNFIQFIDLGSTCQWSTMIKFMTIRICHSLYDL